MYKIISTIFLITSASVGGGIVAQPILINKFGIIPNLISLIISLIYTYISSFIIVKLYIKSNKRHYFSMFEYYIGKKKNVAIAIIYLLICLLSLTSYFNGIKEILHSFNIKILKDDFFLLFTIFFILLMSKQKTINFANNFLELFLLFFFFLLLTKGIEFKNFFLKLSTGKSENFVFLLPIFITSLSYQIIIPNIVEYLNKDEKLINISIISSLFLSACFFLFWNLIIINNINIDELRYFQFSNKDLDLYINLLNKETKFIVKLIVLLILITSILGIGFGAKELLKDAINSNEDNLISISIIVFIGLNSKISENKFIELLEITSIYGEVILNGIIPSFIYVKVIKKKYYILFLMFVLEVVNVFFNFNKF